MLIRASDASFPAVLLLAPATGIFLVAWEASAAQRSATAFVGGQMARRPYATLRLERPNRPTRHIFAFRAEAAATDEISIRDRDELIHSCSASDALSDPAPLLDDLDPAQKAQLLRFVLGYLRGAFHLSDNRDFAAFAYRLALASGASEPPLTAAARIGPLGVLWRGSVASAAPLGAAYVIDGARVFENPVPLLARTGDSGRVELSFATLACKGSNALAVLTGTEGVAIHSLTSSSVLPNLAQRAERGEISASERGYIIRFLGALATVPEAAQIARALGLAAPEAVRNVVDKSRPLAAELELTVDCGEAGLFARGWVRDPHALLSDVNLVSPFGERSLTPLWHRLERPEIEKKFAGSAHPARHTRHGFIARIADLKEPVPVLQHRLRLVASGAPIEIVGAAKAMTDAEARNAVLGTISDRELTDEILASTIAPAAQALHARVMAQPRRTDVVQFGRAPERPVASIIIPLYKNLEFLRFQIAAFAVDPEIQETEIVFVLDSPEQRADVEHLLTGLHALYALPFQLVVMPCNLGYAAANNAGARVARGDALLLLNSDVIPAAPGWLGPLLTALARPGVGAVGPKLLFDDGSLQHAGLYFDRDAKGVWYNRHFFKGYPRDFAPAAVAREVPGVTGAAFLLRRSTYEAVNGLCEDFIIGDYEDSDLCLRIRATGDTIRYEPSAELYHFERRSIRHHTGYTRTVACAYNRRLHISRWDGAMDEVMRSFAMPNRDRHRPESRAMPSGREFDADNRRGIAAA
jgi:GT2 family glycosyltransferase